MTYQRVSWSLYKLANTLYCLTEFYQSTWPRHIMHKTLVAMSHHTWHTWSSCFVCWFSWGCLWFLSVPLLWTDLGIVTKRMCGTESLTLFVSRCMCYSDDWVNKHLLSPVFCHMYWPLWCDYVQKQLCFKSNEHVYAWTPWLSWYTLMFQNVLSLISSHARRFYILIAMWVECHGLQSNALAYESTLHLTNQCIVASWGTCSNCKYT